MSMMRGKLGNARATGHRALSWVPVALLVLMASACDNSNTSDPATGGDSRTVSHAMGETTVSGAPKRVVVLDTGELDSVVTLGVTPVGAVAVSPDIGFPEYLTGDLTDVTEVGTIAEPNLETIASLKPDLILSNKLRHEAIYSQLSEIAPTVLTETVGATWKENFELHAEALGLSDEAQDQLGDYDDATAKLRKDLGSDVDTTVSVIRSLGDEVRIMMKDSFIGAVIADVGLPRPPAQDKDVFMEEASLDRVPDMDGDVMFVSRFDDANDKLETLMASPAWEQLAAVQNDDVHEVPDDYWELGTGMGAAQLVVGDLDKILGELGTSSE